jgi:hypothetical protein
VRIPSVRTATVPISDGQRRGINELAGPVRPLVRTRFVPGVSASRIGKQPGRGLRRDANKIARLSPSNGIVTEYTVPTPDCQPSAITTGPDGNIWFTEDRASKIGRFTP